MCKEVEDGKEYCCCEDNCCYNKCTLEKPPRICLRYVPNSQWIYKKDLGYFQAFQYGKNHEMYNLKILCDNIFT